MVKKIEHSYDFCSKAFSRAQISSNNTQGLSDRSPALLLKDDLYISMQKTDLSG